MGTRDQDDPRSHTTIAHTTPRTWREEGELFTYASQDEHGQHYHSYATKWGWREDENRAPYKQPKAILQPNPKKNNSITNPPFTRKENLSLVSFGWARAD